MSPIDGPEQPTDAPSSGPSAGGDPEGMSGERVIPEKNQDGPPSEGKDTVEKTDSERINELGELVKKLSNKLNETQRGLEDARGEIQTLKEDNARLTKENAATQSDVVHLAGVIENKANSFDTRLARVRETAQDLSYYVDSSAGRSWVTGFGNYSMEKDLERSERQAQLEETSQTRLHFDLKGYPGYPSSGQEAADYTKADDAKFHLTEVEFDGEKPVAATIRALSQENQKMVDYEVPLKEGELTVDGTTWRLGRVSVRDTNILSVDLVEAGFESAYLADLEDNEGSADSISTDEDFELDGFRYERRTLYPNFTAVPDSANENNDGNQG